MSIATASTEYEDWLRSVIVINEDELNTKHQKMLGSEFAFLRATFYRWAQMFPKHCPELNQAIKVLGVGDLHMENFGTWRDADGRLCWGVNDFDEACYLPYTNDLVRLATSAYFAIRECRLNLEFIEACRAIEKGYRKGIQEPRPFVLAENNGWLRNIVIGKLLNKTGRGEEIADKDDLFKKFFNKCAGLSDSKTVLPDAAREALDRSFPQPTPPYEIKHRLAGLGSLGRQRFTAVVKDWQGGVIVREAKELAPSAWLWANKSWDESCVTDLSAGSIYYAAILQRAVRSADPWLKIVNQWVVRRLGPEAFKVEINDMELKSGREAELTQKLLQAMGKEIANIHWSSIDGARKVAGHLQELSNDPMSSKWLYDGAKTMAEQTEKDFQNWKREKPGIRIPSENKRPSQ